MDSKFIQDLSKYSTTWPGGKLLEKYPDLKTFGIWHIYGEDPNCDLGGHHHEPFLGTYKGTLQKVLEAAFANPRFYTWGGGGRIEKISIAELN